MKKYLLTFFSVAAIALYVSCGSTPTTEPASEAKNQVTEEPAAVEEPAPEVQKEPAPSEDFSAANNALMSQVDSARQKAVDAGAEKYFPDVLAATDSYYKELKSKIDANPSADYSAELKDVIERYNALATASLAKEMQEKAKELGLSDADAEDALKEFENSGNGADMQANANKALSAYSALLLQHLGAMAKTERNAALEAKKKADSVKAGVAKKAEYTAASNTFKKADSALVTKNLEGAYKGYREAKNTFNSLYESIAEKRAAAQAAIERAKQRVAEAESYTIEADSIAPLQGEVAGIEKEDAVLLEEDSFANPDDAIIDVEDSAEAKTAATINNAVDAAANVLEGAVK